MQINKGGHRHHSRGEKSNFPNKYSIHIALAFSDIRVPILLMAFRIYHAS